MQFLYLRDPVFLFSLFAFWANRGLLQPLTKSGLFHTSLNDLICIPFWVPLMLWVMRRLHLRGHDGPPRWYEILTSLIWWSFVLEWWVPRSSPFRGLTVADPLDVVSYAVGALFAAMFWRWRYRKSYDRSELSVP
jgi:hypothetical protein